MKKNYTDATTVDKLGSTPPPKESIKRSPGRPKKYEDPAKQISINLPAKLLDQCKEVQGVCGSMREYITRLIREDMEAHYEEYKEMARRFR